MKKVLFAASLVVAVGGIIYFSFFQEREPSTRVIHVTSAVDVSDPEVLVGFADNVFIGKVESQKGTKKINSETPETQFQVKVKKNIKGELSGTVVVNQQGGFDTEQNQMILVEGDTMVKPDKTYLFVTRYNKEHDFHTLVPEYGDLLISNEDEEVKLTEKFKAAHKNQVPFVVEPGPGPDTGNN
jgi:hypothetical protein